MLKLPALRTRLQALAGDSESLGNLCEAYEEASVALERLRNGESEADQMMVREYETVCLEIEADVIRYCMRRGATGLE